MLVAFLSLLFIPTVFAESFSSDLAKINYRIAEDAIESVARNPEGEQTIPAEFFSSLALASTLDPKTGCETTGEESKPQSARYKLLMVTEEKAQQDSNVNKVKVVLAKIKLKEEDPLLIQKTKEFFSSHKNKAGSFSMNDRYDADADIIHYTAPGTTVVLNSRIELNSGSTIDLENINNEEDIYKSSLTTGVVNELKVSQELSADTTIKANMEAIYSNGENGLDAIKDVKLQLTSIKSSARLDSKLDTNVNSYAEVNFSGNNTDQTTRYTSGVNFTLPDNAEIIVFTGYRTQKQMDGEGTKNSKEFGVEYKTKKGVKIYGRMKEDVDNNKVYETGVEVKFR